jgi:hypothetical protein
MSIVLVRCLRRYHPGKVHDNRLHQTLVVAEPEAYNVPVGPGVELDHLLPGQPAVQVDRHAKEASEWRHGAELALRKEFRQLRLRGEPKARLAEEHPKFIHIHGAIGAENRHAISVFLDEDHGLCDFVRRHVFRRGHLPGRICVRMGVMAIRNVVLIMDPDTYEQIAIPESMVGPQAAFLLPKMRLNIDLVEGTPVGVQFPEMMEVRVADTAAPIHQQQDNTWKPARLENGLEIMVPQFIKTGDKVRLDVENLKYMDRARGTTK